MSLRDVNNGLSAKLQRILEEDKLLDVAEKISLVFLMCDDALKAHCILKKNIFDRLETNKILPDLVSYLTNTNKQLINLKFLESLILIKNYEVVKLLGYTESYINSCKEMLKASETKTYINSVRKALLRMCESMTDEELTCLTQLIERDFVDEGCYFSNRNPREMEINLLYLIYEDYISDGTSNNVCNLANLIRNLLKMNKHDLAKELGKIDEIYFSANENNLNDSEYQNIMCPDNDSVEKCSPYSVTPKIVPADKDHYKMDKNNMGLCIVVNQRNFSKEKCSKNGNISIGTRYGTNCDRDMLNITFTGLGFHVVIIENVESYALCQDIKNLVQKFVKNKHSSLVLCILSHGKQDEVICVDGIAVPVEKIENIISGDQCPQLLGKPKIVFIQACQGKAFQKARVCSVDGINMPECDGPTNSMVSQKIPPTADMLTFWASVPGYASIRFRQTGSVFIQTLCAQLLKQDHFESQHLEDIVRIVNDQLSRKHFGTDCIVSMPQVKHTITKKLYFPYSPQHRFKAAKMLYLKFLIDEIVTYCIFHTACREYYYKNNPNSKMPQKTK